MISRRAFLTSAPALPLVALPALAAAPVGPGLRIIGRGWDEMHDDPGHKLWAQHIGTFSAGWRVRLDGVDQYWFSAADENERWVRRTMTVGDVPSFGATLCLDGKGEWFEEIVYGDVEIIPLVTLKEREYYPFDLIRETQPLLYSRLKVEGVNCEVGEY